MNKKAFKIWLITHDYNQIKLAEKLDISPRTLANYTAANRFPVMFQYALKGLSHETKNK